MAPAGPRGNPSDVSSSANALLSGALPSTAILTISPAAALRRDRLLEPIVLLVLAAYLVESKILAVVDAPGWKKAVTESGSRSDAMLARERAAAVLFIVEFCGRREWGGVTVTVCCVMQEQEQAPTQRVRGMSSGPAVSVHMCQSPLCLGTRNWAYVEGVRYCEPPRFLSQSDSRRTQDSKDRRPRPFVSSFL